MGTMDRRKFLGSMAFLGMQGAILKAAPFGKWEAIPADKARRKKKEGGTDDNLVVFISDLHIHPDGYQPEKLRRTIADILAMDPKPRNVIALGDLAYAIGKPEDYALLKEIVAPLETAGIHLTMAMGNHDRRKRFAEAFPEMAAATHVKDRFVFVVETPRADFILLDSLQEDPDPEKGIVEGALNDAQKQWLADKLSSYTDKPVFVSSHHPIEETGISGILVSSPTCSGYLFGHRHIWLDAWMMKNYAEQTLIRTLCIPSTGHWGDIGYTVFRLEEDHAEARFHEYEFFFPKPLAEGEEKPAQWTMIEREHGDSECMFAYRKA